MKIISLLLSYVKTFRDFFFLHFLFSIIHRFLIEIHAMLLSLFNWDSEQVHRVDIYFFFMLSENSKTKICAPCELQCVEWGQCILCRKEKANTNWIWSRKLATINKECNIYCTVEMRINFCVLLFYPILFFSLTSLQIAFSECNF